MTDTARPAQTGRYRSVPPSRAYLMEWTGGVLFNLGQFRRKLLSRLVQLKLSTTQVAARYHGLSQAAETGGSKWHCCWQFWVPPGQRSGERRFRNDVLIVDCPLLWIGLDDSTGDKSEGELHTSREIRRAHRETVFRD